MCFSKLTQFRRVATRFEKTARDYRAVVTLAAIVLWLQEMSTPPSLVRVHKRLFSRSFQWSLAC
ncbi:hypothetical protein GCM10007880_67820 [Mesorhizobium amorphae]|nr:hypothetical protein GCM10007880_67820 [Mesorhizobium amorphae]